MLKFRIISLLYIRNDHVIQPIRMDGVRKMGNPGTMAVDYEEQGVDEIYYVDCVSSLYGRSHLQDLVSDAANFIMTPLTAAGGVRSMDDFRVLLNSGADKVALNTAALKDPELITLLAEKFGSQAVVVHIDAKKIGDRWVTYIEGGRQPFSADAIEWAQEAVKRGAGELVVTSIDRQGTGRGLDLSLTEAVCNAVNVPVIASGGYFDKVNALTAHMIGASGIAIASALHQKKTTVTEIKKYLDAHDVPVRLEGAQCET